MNNVLEALQADFKLFLRSVATTRPTLQLVPNIQSLIIYNMVLSVFKSRPFVASVSLGSLCFCSLLFNDSEKKIMIISASKERADNMSIFLQKLIIETAQTLTTLK